MLNYLFIYLSIINCIGIYVMFADKKRARRQQYRIPESTLWTVALLGGAVGSIIGMQWFRHKTKHFSFKWGMPVLALIEAAIVVYVIGV